MFLASSKERQREEDSKATGVEHEWGWGSHTGQLFSHDACSSVPMVQTSLSAPRWPVPRQSPRICIWCPSQPPHPPENLETCLSASISENIRLLFTSPFPSPLFFLPQQTKSQAFSTLLRLHRTKTQKMGLCPVWASRRLGSLTAGPSSSYSLSCNSIQMALAFTRSFFAAMLRVLFI